MLFSKNKPEKMQSRRREDHPRAEAAPSKSANTEGASVKILGAGCAKCNALEEATSNALKALHMDCAIDHITDFAQIAAYGVMSTPALVVDGKVLSCGRALSAEEAAALLQKARG